MTLQTERLRTMEQIRAFVEGCESVDYKPQDRAGAYAFVRRTLVRFDYARLGRADRGWVRAYIGKVCGFSPSQITRLIRQQAATGAVEDRRARNSGRAFETVYTPVDVRLLADMDEAFGGMSGLATCELLRRAFEVHGDRRFERLARLSRSHLYNLRASRTYRTKRTRWEKTRASPVAIAVRQGAGAQRSAGLRAGGHGASGRPGRTQGRVRRQHGGRSDAVRARRRRAGHLRAVHGADSRSAAAPVPVPRAGLPRRQRLGVRQPPRRRTPEQAPCRRVTKSRPRHSNDNALVEGKNAHVVRKHLGHEHIPVRFAGDVDRFAREHLSPFLNFHRPCLFATERVGAKGKVRRTYRRQDVLTPLDKLKSLPGARPLPAPRRALRRPRPCRRRALRPAGCQGPQPRPRRIVPQGPRRRAGRGMTGPALSTACPPALGRVRGLGGQPAENAASRRPTTAAPPDSRPTLTLHRTVLRRRFQTLMLTPNERGPGALHCLLRRAPFMLTFSLDIAREPEMATRALAASPIDQAADPLFDRIRRLQTLLPIAMRPSPAYGRRPHSRGSPGRR